MARNTCIECNGRGTAMPYRTMAEIPGSPYNTLACERCGGSGKVGSAAKGLAIGVLCSAVAWAFIFWIAV